ncbi:ATP phosphoribosyltransferase regulatory subunit [Bengtsoniella intestinalis]|uniref:ATP phosphoribosyltransferase regulatory subunit n=1 Tax=Bengtsoniella intestinalis TaxID=3073143 RepID=UPI00391F4225
MEFNLNKLKPQEQVSLKLRLLYEDFGYQKYRMGRFEEYGLYQENRRFLSSEQVLTFTDLDGRLLALKPDVTLSIAKNAKPEAGTVQKYYYSENVYRPSQESHTFREISQMGVECIGAVSQEDMAQVVGLAIESLATTQVPFALELSHMGFVTGLLDAVGAPANLRPALLQSIRNKSIHQLEQVASDAGLSRQGLEALGKLIGLSGDWQTVLSAAAPLALNAPMGDALDELTALMTALGEQAGVVKIDLSLVNDMEYYNGLVMQGYLDGLPRAVLRGGRYDPLVEQFRAGNRAIGFALYLDEMSRLELADAPQKDAPVMLNVALPKGRLGTRCITSLPLWAMAVKRITTTAASWWWKMSPLASVISW